jgi:hypothetical protein
MFHFLDAYETTMDQQGIDSLTGPLALITLVMPRFPAVVKIDQRRVIGSNLVRRTRITG